MIDPPPCAFIRSAACLMTKAVPSTFTPRGTIQCSASRCSSEPGKPVPALASAMSRFPSPAASSTAAATCSSWVTSQTVEATVPGGD